MLESLSDQQWTQYEEEGYLRLGKQLEGAQLRALQQRIDQIMLGRAGIDYNRVMMQLDSDDGRRAGPQSKGHKGATLNYRKIQNLEYDPLFLEYMQRPLFRHICARVYGEDTRIAVFRAMFMNKPAHKGTYLVWHQDRWKYLDRDPLITFYTALDPASRENGCVQLIPGSHKRGLLNPEHGSGFLSEAQAKEVAGDARALFLEMEAGEVTLLHNWLLHSSAVNRSAQSRRAFSVCAMPAETRRIDTEEPASCSILFGPEALTPAGVVQAYWRA